MGNLDMSSMRICVLVLIAAASAAPLGSSFDQQMNERMVRYSGAAYCAGAKSIATWSCYACKMVPGLLNITSVHDKATDGRSIVGYDPELKAAVVMFMGTNGNINTWIDDLKSATATAYEAPGCDNCSVAKGFFDTWIGQKEQVYQALQHVPAGVPLYVTGHSLGASVATLFAMDYVNSTGKRPDAVFTFGQPRVGNAAFAEYYTSKVTHHWRSTHHQDPIPHLPYEWMGFNHITTEVFYSGDDGTTHRICSSSDGEDSSCADQFDGDLIHITDHWYYAGFSFLQGVLRCTL